MNHKKNIKDYILFKAFICFGIVFSFILYTQVFPQDDPQNETKAALLEQVSTFIEWPVDSSNINLNSSFIIGVLGNSPINKYLETMYREKEIKGKKVLIKHITAGEEIEDLHILFIPHSEKRAYLRINKRLKKKPVLLFSDMEHFCDKGGHINFYTTEGIINFSINYKAIREAGMLVNPQLLLQAKIVREQ